MGSIRDLKFRAETLLASLPDVLENALAAAEDGIIEAVQKQMREGWERGPNGEKVPLGTTVDRPAYASVAYDRLKRTMYPEAGGRVNLHYTGAYASKITVSLVGESMIVESTDSKAQDLEKKYGAAHLELADDYLTDVVEDTVRPAFIDEVQRTLGLPSDD